MKGDGEKTEWTGNDGKDGRRGTYTRVDKESTNTNIKRTQTNKQTQTQQTQTNKQTQIKSISQWNSILLWLLVGIASKKRQEEEDAEAAAELQAQEEGQAVEVGSLVE